MFEIRRSEEITHRNEFSLLCDWRRIVRAVEVGTEFGHFADEFLKRWRGELLICVDDYDRHADDHQTSDRTPDMLVAAGIVAKHGSRARLVRAKSLDAARHLFKWFGPEFIYIDAGHSYEDVRADLAAWWERLSPLGIIAGHDYGNPEHPGVQRAVDEFAARHDLIVRVTDEYPASWYAYRNEPTAAWTRIQRESWTVLPRSG